MRGSRQTTTLRKLPTQAPSAKRRRCRPRAEALAHKLIVHQLIIRKVNEQMSK
jgi:hypothetical protein